MPRLDGFLNGPDEINVHRTKVIVNTAFAVMAIVEEVSCHKDSYERM